MKTIADLPDETILTWWSEAPAGEDYQLVATLAASKGAITSPAKARRHIKQIPWLKRRLPRPPRSRDYETAKSIWRAQRSIHELN